MSRYGKRIQVSLKEISLENEPHLAVTVIQGSPMIFVAVLRWMNIFYGDCQQDREIFETTFVSAFLHELIHLALGLVPQADVEIDRQHMYDSERIVWAKTCEDVIRLFVERGRSLGISESMYYQKWQECGRNQLSRRWKDFITEIYKDINF